MTGQQLVDEHCHNIRRAAIEKLGNDDCRLLLTVLAAVDRDLFDRTVGSVITGADQPSVLIGMLHEIGPAA